MQIILIFLLFLLSGLPGQTQIKWINVDSAYQPLPNSMHVYKTTSPLDGKPNIAFYVEADLKDFQLEFTVDTSRGRRLTPAMFYVKNQRPLLVVNTTFFSFETNRSLNLVVKDGKKIEQVLRRVRGRGPDSMSVWIPHLSAIGISKKRNADIAWIKSDTTTEKVYASQQSRPSSKWLAGVNYVDQIKNSGSGNFSKWKMQTAIGGGPVLVQDAQIKITNEEELMFAGRAIHDKHPRTAIGYTSNNKLIILVIQGRFPGMAEGATLGQEAQIFKDLGCWEAMNLDGGGSSCLLINGKETIRVSDAAGQRSVPAVFIIKQKSK